MSIVPESDRRENPQTKTTTSFGADDGVGAAPALALALAIAEVRL